MIAVTPTLRALLAEHHVLLRLSSDDELIIDPLALVQDSVIHRIQANRPRLIAELIGERTTWLQHWFGLVRDLDDGFARYMSDDCSAGEQNHWISLLNLAEYAELEVLRRRYGLTGCPAEDGECDPDWPTSCSYCADHSGGSRA